MKQYLLSIYQPDGDPPPPAVLQKIMQDVEALNRELKSAGVWVFSGGSTRRAPPRSSASMTATRS